MLIVKIHFYAINLLNTVLVLGEAVSIFCGLRTYSHEIDKEATRNILEDTSDE